MPNQIDIAIDVAKEAGALQLESIDKSYAVEQKGPIDIVTEIDRKSEDIIVNRFEKEFPSYDILTEEGSGRRKDSKRRWIIDPLDGTVNYKHGYPYFGVSIALEENGKVVIGVVYIPKLNELFIAEEKGGAELNGRTIHVSTETEMTRTLLATGFTYNLEDLSSRRNMDHFEDFMLNSQAIRRAGMAAGDLSYVACGRLDGTWQMSLKPWDMAAGALIVLEAGGSVTDLSGGKFDIYKSEVLASNGHIHYNMIDILNGRG